MRGFRWAVTGLVIAAIAAIGSPTAPASAATATVPHVSVTPTSVSVDGLADVAVTVQVDIDDPRGTPYGVSAFMETTEPATGEAWVPLVEVAGSTSGTRTTYRGTWLAGSTRTGTWLLAHVQLNNSTEDIDLRATPTAGRTVVITGTHVPTLSSTLIPTAVPYGARQWVQYTLRHSDGTPLAGVHVRVVIDLANLELSNLYLRTDSHGRVTVRILAGSSTHSWFTWASTAQPGSLFVVTDAQAARNQYYAMVRGQAPPAVRYGRTFTVVATVSPAKGTGQLQRLFGHTWMTVKTSRIRPSGHATFTYPTVAIGPLYLRIRASGGAEMAPTTSRVFVVQGAYR